MRTLIPPISKDATFDEASDAARALRKEMSEIRTLSRQFSSTLSQGLKSAIADGKELDDVLRQMTLSISGRLLERALNPLTEIFAKGIVGGFQGLAPAAPLAQGGAASPFSGVVPMPFAKGGVVAAPAYFPVGSGAVGVAGEAGAEAILPLSRGADGRLGVGTQANGGVSVTLNISTPDAESFRRSQGQVSAMLARAVGRGRRGL